MSQKTMIALAASVTAFVLVIAGGVFARVSEAGAAADPAAAVNPAVSRRVEPARGGLPRADRPGQPAPAVGERSGLDAQTAAAEPRPSLPASPRSGRATWP